MGQELPGKKKNLILEAAAEVFARRGFHGSTVEEIAQRAGVGKGTIYEYFSSKKDLFHQLITAVMEEMITDLRKRIDQAGEVQEKLRILVEEGLNHFQRLEQISKILMTEVKNARDEEIKEIFLQKHESIIGLISGVIEEGMKEGRFRQVDKLLAAQLFIGTLSSIIVSTTIYNRERKTSINAVLDLFLHGIST